MSAARADLAIAGGGPGGAVLALLAARAGMRVVLLEQARFPRPKPCGGVLSPRAVEILSEAGLLQALRAAGAAPIRRLHVLNREGEPARLPYGQGLALERERLDCILLEAAARAGADVRTGTRVLAVELDSGRIPARLRVLADAGPEPIEAEWVAGAGGGLCPIRRALLRARPGPAWPISPRRRPHRRRPPAPGGAGSAIAVCAILEGIAAPPGVCEMHLLGDGYCGVAAAGAGQTTIGMVLPAGAWRALEAAPADALGRALEAHPRLGGRLRGMPVARGPWVTGSLWSSAPLAVPPGVVLVGDALARMEPITGEGMAMAVEAARAAARWLARSPDPRGAPRLHRRLLRNLQGARRRSALAAALSRSPSAARLAVKWARRLPPLAALLGRCLAGARAERVLHDGHGRTRPREGSA